MNKLDPIALSIFSGIQVCLALATAYWFIKVESKFSWILSVSLFLLSTCFRVVTVWMGAKVVLR